jgi:hypothetical protein
MTKQDHLDALRREIADTAWSVGVHSSLVIDYAALGDDQGLRYALKCMTACNKAVLNTFKALIELKIGEVKS